MKLEEFLKCEHDIDMNTSMTRLYCLKCGQDKNVIDYVKKLQKENELLRECVEFYGKSLNWSNSNGSSYYEDFLLIKGDSESFGRESVGGKRARECLAKLGER